jgi:hypothetical protein
MPGFVLCGGCLSTVDQLLDDPHPPHPEYQLISAAWPSTCLAIVPGVQHSNSPRFLHCHIRSQISGVFDRQNALYGIAGS